VSELGHWGLVQARDAKPADLDPSYLVWGFRKRAILDALPDHQGSPPSIDALQGFICFVLSQLWATAPVQD
jgi:hypothetical protein